MLFNSIEYLLFLPTVIIIYWLLQKRLRAQNLFLLAASYLFYGWWDWRFLSLIIISSFVDYFVGLSIFKSKEKKACKRWLLLSLFTNLGLLAVFKYFNFFAETFAQSMRLFGWHVNDVTLNIILPVGISFYTFQTLSYTIDIYRKKIEPTKNIVAFFTYVSLFPQLVAGPIERASNLLPQVESSRKLTLAMFKAGLFQIFIGLFRKVVIADNLAVYVDPVYAHAELHNGATLLLATLFYAFQIYFDFAGYSDIAIGSAKLIGFNFKRNFNLPYFSHNITTFWRKWHISLSNWLRDYLYISLGGNRKRIKITYRNLIITMLLGGLWHGSAWNFVIWGGIHGLFLSLEKRFFNLSKSPHILGYVYTFCVVLLSWIFFRSSDFSTAILIIERIVSQSIILPFVGDINALITALAMLSVGLLFDYYLFKKQLILEEIAEAWNIYKLGFIISAIIILLELFYSTSENFIYFQF